MNISSTLKLLFFLYTTISSFFKSDIVNERQRRAFVNYPSLKWKHFPIKYKIDSNLSDTTIISTLKTISSETCISFQQATNFNGDGIHFTLGTSTTTTLGKVLGNKPSMVYITKEHMNSNTIIERLVLRVLGVIYEHNRPNRDRFINVNYQNLKTEYKYLFNKQLKNSVLTYGVNYDFGSRMHFNKSEGSKSNLAAFESKKSVFDYILGRTVKYSFNDIKLLNYHYCSSTCSKVAGIKCYNKGYQSPKNCSKCSCPHFFDGDSCENYKTSTDKSCGSSILTAESTAKTIYFQGPQKCFKRIHASKGKKIHILFLSSNYTNIKPCPIETGLEILYLTDKSVSGPLFCGNVKQKSLTSEDNVILLKFSDNSSNFSIKIGYVAVRRIKISW
uniref:Metalloendopeptidase n=1 Tax=Strongyloides papillosus TaxID=174720 RepID=A0A0N5BV68_STREA